MENSSADDVGLHQACVPAVEPTEEESVGGDVATSTNSMEDYAAR
jgi:hypothetical protein